MSKTYYVSDAYNYGYAWTFDTLAEAQETIELVKIADYKQDPDADHWYIITEESPF
jgi:hypothetical protein